MKQKPTALAIPDTLPKATKSDIVKAAVERARTKHEQTVAKYRADYQKLMEKLKQAAILECLNTGIENMEVEVSPYRDISTLRTALQSPAVRAVAKAIEALLRPGHFNETDVKQAITCALDETPDRIGLILSVPENVSKIDALLSLVFQPATKTIENQ